MNWFARSLDESRATHRMRLGALLGVVAFGATACSLLGASGDWVGVAAIGAISAAWAAVILWAAGGER